MSSPPGACDLVLIVSSGKMIESTTVAAVAPANREPREDGGSSAGIYWSLCGGLGELRVIGLMIDNVNNFEENRDNEACYAVMKLL